MIRVKKISAFVFRAPLGQPARSAVVDYPDRPAVFVSVEDDTGITGWGEVFCNVPPCGAEHRARLIDTIFGPLLKERGEFVNPAEAFQYLYRKTEILTLKSGEFGPFSQCIAGLDIAMWDLWARYRGKPIWKLLNKDGNPALTLYASGLGPDQPEAAAAEKQAEGYQAFKLKVGFSRELDLQNIRAVRDALGSEALIMVDANQLWNLQEAVNRIRTYAPYGLYWVEEPIRCNRPEKEWRQLAEMSDVPLAAGENLRGAEEIRKTTGPGYLQFIQPDIIKWGGFSGLWPVVGDLKENFPRLCPHNLAGGIALVASSHLLAACPNPGLLEVDAQENPLRSELFEQIALTNGILHLPDSPGLGVAPDPNIIERYRIYPA